MAKKKLTFAEKFAKYIAIESLEFTIRLHNGEIIEVEKNRELKDNTLYLLQDGNVTRSIEITDIQSVDFFAA